MTARRGSWLAATVAAVSGALLCAGPPARADVLDLALQRLVTPPAPGVAASPKSIDQVAFRTLASELGVVLAPPMLAPADTIGYSGYQLSTDARFTTISNQACNADETANHTVNHCPWSAGTSGRDGQGTKTTLPGFVSSLSVTVRKGFWLPLPVLELGAGGTKVFQSNFYALYAFAKLAIQEGYHDWALPSLSVRASVSRMLGSSQLDLTMVQLDAEISKSFGLFGTVTFAPYFGVGALLTVARGGVVDLTPGIDAYKGGSGFPDLNQNAVFPDQDTIVRWRFHLGFRMNYSILMLAFEYALSACGDFTGSPSEECNHAGQAVADQASTQHSLGGSIGFLF